MKKVSLLAAALAVSTSVAQAQAPVAPCAPAPTPCPCPKAFQGFYFGGNLGYGWGAVRINNVVTSAVRFGNGLAGNTLDKTHIAAQGFDGGLLIGGTYVFSNKVGLGFDIYFNWTSTKGRLSSTAFTNTYQNVILKNSLQLRVPISYVIANLVAPKVIFGWDNSQWQSQLSDGALGLSRQYSKRYNGFLWGGGVDFLLAKHVISGFEYTGVVSQNANYTDQQGQGSTFSFRPVYNKIAVTLKFIY